MKRIYLVFAFAISSLLISAQPCTNIFFSEYVEGSSFNKALELYNPTSLPINLTGYKILQYNSGASHQIYTLNLFGIVPAGATFVIMNSQADSTLKLLADTLSGNSAMGFNGDDPLILVNGTDTIDAIGVWGNNVTDTALLKDKTLTRKSTIQGGNSVWQTGATEWDITATNSQTLGTHTATACALPLDTTIQFIGTSVTVGETQGVYNIVVALNQPQHSGTITATVDFTGSTPAAATSADIGSFAALNISFPPNVSVVNVPVTIADDADIEGDETFSFQLTNIVGAVAGISTDFDVTIAANDSVVIPSTIPFYTIGTINTEDADGVADSLNVKCRTSGVVYGINTRKSGLQFIISDHTGWIQVYAIPSNTYGYTVTEGDSIVIEGEVDQYFGMTQMSYLDTIIKVSSGNALRTPSVISTQLAENMEASIVRVNNATLSTPSQWTGSGSGFTVTAVSGGVSYRVRIDSLTSAYGVSAPTSTFDVIGWVSQYDTCNPTCLGFYQLNPRYAADIIKYNSINEVSENTVAVYPNPSNGTFHLLTNINADAAKVVLYNIIGSKVYEAYLPVNNNDITIKASFNSGSYFGVLETETAKQKFRFDVVK